MNSPFRSIRSKLFFWFIFITLIPPFILSFLNYTAAIHAIEDQVTSNLSAISANKARQIENHIDKRKQSVEILAATPIIVSTLELVNQHFNSVQTNSPDAEPVLKNAEAFLSHFKKNSGIYDLFLISQNGDIVLTAVREDDFGTNLVTGRYRNTHLAQSFAKVKNLPIFSISDSAYYAPSDTPATFFMMPVLKNNRFLGAVAIQMNTEEIFHLTADYTGLGETGEIILATKNQDRAVSLTKFRKHPETKFELRIGSANGIPIQEAVSGKRGSGIFPDYLGNDIIASWRYLPDLRWGMVVKIDTNEAFAPIFQLRKWYASIGGSMILILILAVIIVSRSISKPIISITQAAKLLSTGDFTKGAKIITNEKNEIGDLAIAFNEMATQRTRAEKSLRDNEEFTRSILESAGEGICGIDTEGTIVFANPAVSHMSGRDHDELLHQPVHNLLHDNSRPSQNECSLTKAVLDFEYLKFEDEWFTHKDGNHYPVAGVINPFTKDGKKAGTVMTFTDITQRKRDENRLKSRERALTRSNQELEKFAYVASHDLQEPLRKVQAFGDRLKKRYESVLDEQGLDYLDRMQNASGRMSTLINDLLNFSRVTTRAQPFEQVNLNKIIKYILSDLEIVIEATQASFEISELPIIEADPLQMRQLFQNMIGNALKFQRPDVPPLITIDGEILTSVSEASQQSEKKCNIRISDNGIGFDPQYSEQIFEVFQKLHGINEYGGTGIGLSICRKIAERHGGTITVESLPDHGAAFTITMEIKHVSDDDY